MENRDGFFPLCIDAMHAGNESRFINHSCDPNLRTFACINDKDGVNIQHMALFTVRPVKKYDELHIDYCWDKNKLDIEKDVPCCCGEDACRKYLMRSVHCPHSDDDEDDDQK